VPPFVVGRVHWAVDVMERPSACGAAGRGRSARGHRESQNHDYGYHSSGGLGVWKGVEAGQNHHKTREKKGRIWQDQRDDRRCCMRDGIRSNEGAMVGG